MLPWQKLVLVITAAATFSPLVPVAAQAAAPDVARGFDLLFELGLPDVSGPEWQYVTLEGLSVSGSFDSYGGSEYEALANLQKIFTRGWVEKPADGSPTPSSRVVATSPGAGAGPDSASGMVVHKHFPRLLLDGWNLQGLGANTTDWSQIQQTGLDFSRLRVGKEPADEKADAKALTLELQTLRSADDNVKRSLYYNPNLLVTILFRAAHHHRRGHKDEAAAAAQALFALVPRQDRLIDLAVEKLAGSRYESAMLRFTLTGDWKALDAELTQILGLYTRGWTERPLVEKLHPLVKQRVASPKAPALAQSSLLTPEQQAWWQQVADFIPTPAVTPDAAQDAPQVTNPEDAGTEEEFEGIEPYIGSNFDFGQLARTWLFDIRMQVDPSSLARWKEMATNAPPWVQDFFTKDWDWITVIAAALGDETLVPTPDVRIYGEGFSSFDFESDPPELSEEEVEEKWQDMNRPRTRNDLARRFLDSVLPRNDQEGDQIPTDPTELRQVALNTARILKGKTPPEVARFYLKTGTQEQKTQAMTALLGNGTEVDIKAVEAIILATPGQHFDLVTLIVKKRKTASKPFLDQFRKALAEETNKDQGNNITVGTPDIPEYMKEQFAALEVMASGRGPLEILTDYAEGRTQSPTVFRHLQHVINTPEEGNPFADQALELVARLPKGQAARKMQILMFTLNYAQELTDARKVLLRKILLADPDSLIVTEESTVAPLSDYVYWVAELAAHSTETRPIYEQLQGMDAHEIMPLWVARGRAVMEGTPLPPILSAARVSPERRQAMLKALDQHLDKGWPEYVQALSFDEKLALFQELQKTPAKPAWTALSQRIIKIQTHPADLPPLEGAAALVGQPLSAAALVKLGEACRNRFPTLAEGQGIRFLITPMALHQGLRIFVTTGTAGDDFGYGTSMFQQAGDWMKQLHDHKPGPATVNGYSWMRWMQGSREMASANWHLDQNNKWQNWPNTEHESLGSAPSSGTPVAEPDLVRALEERIKAWDTSSGAFWFETGVMKPASPETKD